jgi:hypothetical protein
VSLRDEIARDSREIISDLGGDTFTWAGTAYSCGPTTETRETVLDTSGNPLNVTLALLVVKADFPNSVPPGSGQKLTYREREYKVARVRDLHGSAAWLFCVDWKSR